MPANDPILIFDLDDTILTLNSFRSFVLYLLRGSFALPPLTRARLTLATIAVMGRRRLLHAGHADTKRALQRLWSEAIAREVTPRAESLFVAELARAVRPSLVEVLDSVRSGTRDGVLTTAAAAEYALPLATRLGFRHVVATPIFAAADYRENLGAAKRDNTETTLRELGWSERPRVFFTDHRDDLPLVQVCGTVVWLGASEKLAAVKAAAPMARILDGGGAGADQIAAFIDGRDESNG